MAAATSRQTERAPEAPALSLPTEKRKPLAGVGKVLLYGGPKVGKSTTAASLDPDALVLDTEGSTVALEAFVVDVRDWTTFRSYGKLIAANPGRFRTVIVDTVDVLSRMCADDVVQRLAGSAAHSETGKTYVHASDFGYGKGWEAIRTEFELRVAKLCQLVPNVIFVSHAKEVKIESRAGDYTAFTPDIAPSSVRKFMEGFVDHILYAQLVEEPDGVKRLLRTQPTQLYQAGGRVPVGIDPLPDPMPLDGGSLRAALEALRAPQKPEGSKDTGEAPAAPQRGRKRAEKPQGGQAQLEGATS